MNAERKAKLILLADRGVFPKPTIKTRVNQAMTNMWYILFVMSIAYTEFGTGILVKYCHNYNTLYEILLMAGAVVGVLGIAMVFYGGKELIDKSQKAFTQGEAVESGIKDSLQVYWEKETLILFKRMLSLVRVVFILFVAVVVGSFWIPVLLILCECLRSLMLLILTGMSEAFLDGITVSTSAEH